LDEVQLEDQEI